MEYAEILTGLRRILRSINLESKKVQKKFGVSIPQLLTIEFLNTCPEHRARASHIKSHLNLNASTVSGILHRLEKKGLITRATSPVDRRVANIVLSPAGIDLLEKAPKTLQEKITEKLGKLPPEELEQLARSVEILSGLFEANHLDASPLITLDELRESG